MITTGDFQQWFDTQWVGVDDSVQKVTDTLDKISLILSSFDGPDFVKAVSEESFDGIPRTTDDACRVVATAQDRLEQLQLTGEQRAVATQNAVTTIEVAINAVRQLATDLDRLRAEEIPGLLSEYSLWCQEIGW